MGWIKSVVKSALRAAARIAFNVKTKDIEKISYLLKQSDRNIFVCNHPSFLDGVILGLFLPCDPVFLVHSSIFKRPVFRFLLQFVDNLPVDPANPMSIKTLTNAVNAGRPVVIFPEGRITTTGGLMKIYEGSAFVAAKTGAQIIPLSLQGLLKSRTSRMGITYPKTYFPSVELQAHAPRKLSFDMTLRPRDRRRIAGEELRHIMQDLAYASVDTDTSLYGAFVRAKKYFGDKHVVMEELTESTLTFGKVNQMAHGVGYLIAKHSAKGSRVGIMLPNMPVGAAAILGCSIYGRVPAMLNYTAGVPAFEASLVSTAMQCLFTSRAFVEKAKLAHLIEVAQAKGVKIFYMEDLKSLIALSDKLTILWRARQNWHVSSKGSDLGVVLFTSGTESLPKGVAHTNSSLLSNVAQVRAVIDITPDDKVLNALPMFHSFGFTAGTLLPMLSGCTLLLYVSPLHYKVIPELCYDRNCTVLFGTNTFLDNYAKRAHNYDFYRLRYVVAGAEKLQPKVREMWMERFGIRILEGYGATECAPVIAVNTPMSNKFGTVGEFLPGMVYKLDPIPGTGGGALSVKGPNIMAGYFKVDKPGVLQPTGEWYDTGDIGEIVEGKLRLCGRSKRFIKSGGEMVALEAVELLASSLTTKGVAAIDMPDEKKGQVSWLFVEDAAVTRDVLRKAIVDKGLSPLTLPANVIVVDKLPLLGTGKLDYQSMKGLAAQWQEEVAKSVEV